MKTRTSFVANSSSSSFLIGCSKVPETVEEAGEIWFGDKKDFVAPKVTECLFNEFKEIKLDIDSMIEMLNTKSVTQLTEHGSEVSDEVRILDEIVSAYVYDEQNDFKDYWSSAEPTNFEIYKENCMIKLANKLNFKSVDDIPWMIKFKESKKITDKYYKLKKNKEWLISHCMHVLSKFKNSAVLMEGEFADEDGGIWAECEHGGHWDKFDVVERFSHH